SLANAPTKKALYLALSDHPIIIDNGHKSVQLDRKTGKFRYMLAARSLTIIWSDHEQYWDWIELPESRFPEVAELRDVCWFDIQGTINTVALSPNTEYAAYLVFKMVDARGFQNRPIELSVFVEGGHSSYASYIVVCV
ncbi:F-box protein PP2-B10-like, partial [Vicia villosa]|uniref:F-box protein PP2-B10-like n=1 Tax=Vicia villosa TaxID=3911 RepID=UPI00273B46F0